MIASPLLEACSSAASEVENCRTPTAPSPQVAAAAQRLRQAFGVDFTIIDGQRADVRHVAEGQPCRDWAERAMLCQEVARRETPQFLEDEYPLVVLAVPLCDESATLVGVAAFVTRALGCEEEIARAATILQCSLSEARVWAARQSPVSAEVLQRLAALVIDQFRADKRIQTLESEVDQLARHVAFTYEEISLIFRLTQNLHINAQEAELGRVALEWLTDIMPFEGMALQFVPRPARAGEQIDSQATQLLTFGCCPLDNRAFTTLVQELGIRGDMQPRVINRLEADNSAVRQLIVIPICEGQRQFGYLAAFNHTQGGEFGTSEADLLGSVAAILGIHSGNAELYHQQAELLSGIVRALTSAIDAKDPYTCGHSDRVARVAVRLAQEMGCNPKTLETIYLAGLLHDVGKIGIDDNVLRKPGKLTDAEFLHIQQHARIGHNILVDLKQLDRVLPVVLHHHEAWDGSGYPDGLAGEEIPALARIVAVADAFDAMKSDRPYRQGMPDDKLDAIIQRGAGTQWDKGVVEAFFRAREDIRQIAQRESSAERLELPHYV